MLFDVRHRTTFRYEQEVSISQHVLHLLPRSFPRQQTREALLFVEPVPQQSVSGHDYFGNLVHYITVHEPHQELVIESRSRVNVVAEVTSDLGAAPAWEQLLAELKEPRGPALQAYEFTFDSPHVVSTAEVKAFAAQSFLPGRPLLEASMDLTCRIFDDFEYQGGVSDVSTPVAEVLSMKKGVCQDFAHLQIACLRSLGLPARYVSGYLLTHPPAGQEKLVGADASHAWVSVWAGRLGWLDFDPTNRLMPREEHITVGWGRDYGDVSPINGFIVGGGSHELAVAVDVSPQTR